MKTPTLEEANLHFANRTLYHVDALDYAQSRNLFSVVNTNVPPRKVKWTREILISHQYLPLCLQHSQAYREKYFPKA